MSCVSSQLHGMEAGMVQTSSLQMLAKVLLLASWQSQPTTLATAHAPATHTLLLPLIFYSSFGAQIKHQFLDLPN